MEGTSVWKAPGFGRYHCLEGTSVWGEPVFGRLHCLEDTSVFLSPNLKMPSDYCISWSNVRRTFLLLLVPLVGLSAIYDLSKQITSAAFSIFHFVNGSEVSFTLSPSECLLSLMPYIYTVYFSISSPINLRHLTACSIFFDVSYSFPPNVKSPLTFVSRCGAH